MYIKVGDWVIGGNSKKIGEITEIFGINNITVHWKFTKEKISISEIMNLECPVVAKVCQSCHKQDCPSIVSLKLNW